MAVSLTVIPALAGDEAKPEAKQDKQERIAQLLAKPEVLFGNEFDIRSLKVPERRAITTFRYERELRQLQEMMLKELELTDLQKEAIAKHIEGQIEYVRLKGGAPRTFSGRQRDPLRETGSTDGPIDPAKEIADPAKKKPGTGYDRIRERNRPSNTMYDDPTALVNLLATELSGLQVDQFSKLSYQWKVLRPFGAADGLFRQLSRAVRDPRLKIEEEQRQSLDKRVQQAMMSLGRDRQYTEKRIAAYEKTKADIVAKLTPDQRSHLENTLNEFRAEFAEEVLLVMDMRAKAKEEAKAKTKDESKAKDDSKGKP